MSGLFGSQQAAAASSTTGDTSKDVEINTTPKPEDSISDLMFSPTNDHLAVSSWDKKVYIYEINGGNAVITWVFTCPGHALCVGWSMVSIFPFLGFTSASCIWQS
jgi:mRNA export factor